MTAGIAELIPIESVKAELQGVEKADVIAELAALLVAGHPQLGRRLTHTDVEKLLEHREKLAATGVGNGIAIPHAASDRVRTTYGGLARARHGVDFGALDRSPCTLFVVLLSPTSSPRVHIKTLSRISRLMASSSTRSALMKAASEAEMLQALVAGEQEMNEASAASTVP